MTTSKLQLARLLIVDDNPTIHEDMRRILASNADITECEILEARVLGSRIPEPRQTYELQFATQGDEAVAMTEGAVRSGQKFQVAFVDVRMPPGMDGIATVEKLWQLDPELQVVLCTAYADSPWEDIVARIGTSDRLVILKKPFEPIEVRQLAHTLSKKWHLSQIAKRTITDLEKEVLRRSEELNQISRHSLERQHLESLATIAGGVSHNFNNLLTIICGYAGLLKSNDMPQDERDMAVSEVIQTVKRAAALCTQLLEVSGQGIREKSITSFDKLTTDCAKLFSVTLPPGIDLEMDIPETLPPVEGDRSALRQLVLNLLTNAAEAMKDTIGTIRVRVSLEVLSPRQVEEFRGRSLLGSNFVQLEVSDDGPGMTREVLSRLFEPFFTTHLFGRGLGLPAVLGILKSHNGGILVSSSPGAGTRVRAILPARRPQNITPRIEAVVSGSLENEVMLFVDDEPMVLNMVQSWGKMLGMEVLVAEDGEQGLALYEKNRDKISIAIVDYQMPRGSGGELCRELRRRDPKLPLLLTSGFSNQQDIRKVLEETTGLKFLGKPFNLAAFQQEVAACVLRRTACKTD